MGNTYPQVEVNRERRARRVRRRRRRPRPELVFRIARRADTIRIQGKRDRAYPRPGSIRGLIFTTQVVNRRPARDANAIRARADVVVPEHDSYGVPPRDGFRKPKVPFFF